MPCLKVPQAVFSDRSPIPACLGGQGTQSQPAADAAGNDVPVLIAFHPNVQDALLTYQELVQPLPEFLHTFHTLRTTRCVCRRAYVVVQLLTCK